MAAEYKKVSLIGSGTFGKVWLVRHLPTGRRCVIKEVAVTSLTDKDKKQALTEVEVLARCRHVNVIRYRGAFIEDSLLNIVMSHADGGDLHMRIQKQRGVHFPEPVILDWFVQIVFALRYIHGLHIVHRDLKTQNIFLAGDNQVKVGDFGIARVLASTDDHAMTAVGTPYYLSPEICQQQPYNHKSDMWSLGCVLYELCCLTHPFDGQNIAALVIKILNGTYAPIPRHYSALLEDLISVLLRGEAEARPSADQILWVPALQQYVQGHMTKSSAMTPTRSAMTPKQIPSAVTSSCIKPMPSVMTPYLSKPTSAMTPPVTKQIPAAMTPSVIKQIPAAMTPSCVKQTPSPAVSTGRRVAGSAQDEKENIMPVPGVKRSRCMSQSTPKTETIVANIRVSNSAECTRESVLARKKAVSKNRPSPTLSLYKQVLRHAHNNSPERDLNIGGGGSPRKSSPLKKICSKTYTVRKDFHMTPENCKGLNIPSESQHVGESGGSPRRKHAVRERKDGHSWSRPVHPAPGRPRRGTTGGKQGTSIQGVQTHRDMQVGRIQQQGNVSNVEMRNQGVKSSQPQEQAGVKFSQPQEQAGVKFSQPQEQAGVKFSQPQEQAGVKFSQPQGQSDVKSSELQCQSGVKFSQPQEHSGVKFSQSQEQSGVKFSQYEASCSGPTNRMSPPRPQPSMSLPDTDQIIATLKPQGIDESLRVSELLYATFCPSQQDAYPRMEKLRSDLENDLGIQCLHDLHKVIQRSREEGLTFKQLGEQLGSEVKGVLPRLLVLMQLEAIVSM